MGHVIIMPLVFDKESQTDDELHNSNTALHINNWSLPTHRLTAVSKGSLLGNLKKEAGLKCVLCVAA